MFLIRFLRKNPSAWIPVVMSLLAIILVYGLLFINGIPQTKPADEGTAAHLWQILMGGQVPVIGYFLVVYFQKKPKEVSLILALQLLLILIAAAPVFLLGL